MCPQGPCRRFEEPRELVADADPVAEFVEGGLDAVGGLGEGVAQREDPAGLVGKQARDSPSQAEKDYEGGRSSGRQSGAGGSCRAGG